MALYIPPRSRPGFNTIVNVQNFGDDMTNEKLYEMFAKFGKVHSYKLMINPYAECQNFGYVAFKDSDAAEDAIIELNGQKINDEYDSPRLKVRRTHTKHPSQPKPKLVRESTTKLDNETQEPNNGLEIFVQNLEGYVDTEMLRIMFRHFGTITSAKIIMENGRSKGYGFITFTRPEAAANAVKGKNCTKFGTKVLHVAIARGKNMSKYSLESISRRGSNSLSAVGTRNRNDTNELPQRFGNYAGWGFRNINSVIPNIYSDISRFRR